MIAQQLGGAVTFYSEACLGQTLSVLDRDVLHAAIGVVDEAAATDGFAIMDSLLQRIQNEASVRRS